MNSTEIWAGSRSIWNLWISAWCLLTQNSSKTSPKISSPSQIMRLIMLLKIMLSHLRKLKRNRSSPPTWLMEQNRKIRLMSDKIKKLKLRKRRMLLKQKEKKRNVQKITLLQMRNLTIKRNPPPKPSISRLKSLSVKVWSKKQPSLMLWRVSPPLSDWWHWKTVNTWSIGIARRAWKYWALNSQAKKKNKSTRISKWRSRIWINYSRRSLNNTKTSTINKWRKNWRVGKVRRPRGRPDRPQSDWLFTCKT